MSDFALRLKWLFSNSGILRRAPTPQEIQFYMMGKHTPLQYTCTICKKQVWAFKPVDICSKFECFKKNGGKWR